MTPELDIDDRGFKQLIRKLDRLPARVSGRVSGRVTSYAATPLLRALRKEVPVYRNVLRKAQGKKTKRYDDTALTIVGARIDGQHRGFHAHLVHDGHIAADGSFVPGNPYQTRAVDQTKDQVNSRLRSKLGQELEKEAMRA